MPQNLQELNVIEIALVDRPACSEVDPLTGQKIARATVALLKRDEEIEKYSTNQGRDGGKFKVGGGVGKDQHAAENASTIDDHAAAITHHSAQAINMGNSPDAVAAHQLAAKAHGVAVQRPGKTPSRVARQLSQVAGHFGVVKQDSTEWDDSDLICKAVDGKTEDGKMFPKSDYAYTPDDNVSEWKLRLTSSPGGAPDPKIVGAAAAAFSPGGYRGKKVELPADAVAGAKAKVRAAWYKANPDKGDEEMPESIKKQGDNEMPITLEELQKRQDAQDASIAKLTADNATLTTSVTTLKAENEAILKMSAKEKATFKEFTDKQKGEYMAADMEKRKAMMDDACKEMEKKEKKAKKAPATDEEDSETDNGDSDGSMAKIAKAEEKLRGEMTVELKKRDETIAKLAADNTLVQKRERTTRFVAIAKSDLSHLSGTDVQKAETLMSIADACGGEDTEVFKNYLNTQRAADKVLARDFGEVGKHGGGAVHNAMALLNAKAEDIVKRDKINKAQAFNKAMLENPELYEQHEQDRRKQ